MKKRLILLMLLVPVAVVAKKKVKMVTVYDFYLADSPNMKLKYFDDGKILVTFRWNCEYNHMLDVTIRNLTDSRISIEWENARIGSNHVTFLGDEYDYTVIPRPNEVIHAGESDSKTIVNRYRSSTSLDPIFNLKYLTLEGDSTTRTVIIPVTFGDTVVDYKFELIAYIVRIYPKGKIW